MELTVPLSHGSQNNVERRKNKYIFLSKHLRIDRISHEGGIPVLFFILVLTFQALLVKGISPPPIVSPSMDSLLALKTELEKNNPGVFQTWDKDKNPCGSTWQGKVQCDSLTREVISLDFSLPSQRLKGPIPGRQLASLTSLKILNLGNNHFSGPIPPELGKMGNLTFLSLSRNLLSGNIPPDLGKLRNLENLDLSHNLLNGSIPLEFQTLTNLKFLSLSENNLTGKLNFYLSKLTKLTTLTLYGNRLSGRLDWWIRRLPNLVKLEIFDNQFIGTIPVDIGTLSKLQYLSLSQNNFSGSIPDSIGSLKELKYLSLSNNYLEGNIPHSFKNLINLINFELSFNPKINGNLPEFFGDLTKLFSLKLQNLSLSGSIPPKLGNLSNLGSLELSQNFLEGEIPYSLGNLKKVRLLNLNNNKFLGKIPETFCDLEKIQHINLAFNQLNGEIPACITSSSTLTYLNVANNKLSGKLPAVNLSSNLLFNYTGNCLTDVSNQLLLCTSSASNSSPSSPYPPSTSSTPSPSPPPVRKSGENTGNGYSFSTVIVTAIMAIVILTAMGAVGFTLRKRFDGFYSNQMRLKLGVNEISLNKIRKATKNFTTVLGDGSFGTTYFCDNLLTDRDSRAVAKRARDPTKHGEFMFKCRVDLLARAHHRNMVNLQGACLTKTEQILVFEYMPNGTLHDRLHGEMSKKPLLWEARVTIAVNVACALEHLHHGNSLPLIHRDVNSSNIFLLEDDSAKLGEFGLSSKESGSQSVKKTRSRRIREWGEVGGGGRERDAGTESGDVYSFGVLLLELLSGQPVMKDGHITSLANPFLDDPQMLILMVDARLGGDIKQIELNLLGGIAKECIREDLIKRPKMKDVLKLLEQHLDDSYFDSFLGFEDAIDIHSTAFHILGSGGKGGKGKGKGRGSGRGREGDGEGEGEYIGEFGEGEYSPGKWSSLRQYLNRVSWNKHRPNFNFSHSSDAVEISGIESRSSSFSANNINYNNDNVMSDLEMASLIAKSQRRM